MPSPTASSLLSSSLPSRLVLAPPARNSLRSGVLAALLSSARLQRRVFAPERFALGRVPAPRPDDPVPRLAGGVSVERWSEQAVAVFTPRAVRDARTLVYLHGGAHVAPIETGHWRFAGRLALELGMRVILPRYPLAPEHDAAASIAMLEAVLDRAADTGPFVLAGDSAGAGKALVLAQRARDRGAAPIALVLYSPFVDARLSELVGSAAERDDPLLLAEHLMHHARASAAGLDLGNPLLSPITGDLAGLPPTAIFTGSRDLLHAQARALAQRMHEAGSPASLAEYPRMVHDWMLLPIPEAARVRAQTAAFLAWDHGAGASGSERGGAHADR